MAKNDKESVINLGSPDLSFDEALDRTLKIQARGFSNDDKPDLSGVKKAILQQGKYVSKVVTCWDIRSRNTGDYKFSNLTFSTLRRTKKRGWEFEIHRAISLGDDQNTDVIEKLIAFLKSLSQIDDMGDVIVFNAKDFDSSKFQKALRIVSGAGQQNALLAQIIDWIHQDHQALEHLFQLSSDDFLRSQSLVAAINYGRYHRALAQFQHMVDDDTLHERDYQKFLEENHWMFGSEYSELLGNRNLVTGQQLDFPLRRTVDGYIDVIEIKTPLGGKSGFLLDKSHNNHYASNDINKHLQQVRSYLSRLEAERDRIKLYKGIDFRQVRGKLIVGRDGDEGETEALRILNADSHKIEVMSFDGLIRIGKRILEIMVTENPILKDVELVTVVNDIPF